MKRAGDGSGPGALGPAAVRADARRCPRPLRVAACAQALQGLLLAGIGLTSCVLGLTRPDDRVNAELVGLLALAGGVALLGVARGLLGARGWARSPALVWQLILLPVGFQTTDDLPAVAYPLLGSAVVVLVGLFAPASGAAMSDGPAVPPS